MCENPGWIPGSSPSILLSLIFYSISFVVLCFFVAKVGVNERVEQTLFRTKYNMPCNNIYNSIYLKDLGIL